MSQLNPEFVKLLEFYDAYLRDNGVGVAAMTPNFVQECNAILSLKVYPGGKLSYIRLMIQRILTEPDIFKQVSIPNHIETPYDEIKMFTWLGFIQGVLWAEGKEGIGDLRTQTQRVKDHGRVVV